MLNIDRMYEYKADCIDETPFQIEEIKFPARQITRRKVPGIPGEVVRRMVDV